MGGGFSVNVTLELGPGVQGAGVHGTGVQGAGRTPEDPPTVWGRLRVGPHSGPFPLPASGPITLRVLVDHSVVEAFAADGRAVVTHRTYPPGDLARGVQIFNLGAGPVRLASFEGYTMRTPPVPSLDELREKAAEHARSMHTLLHV